MAAAAKSTSIPAAWQVEMVPGDGGQMPNNGVFHVEATALLRPARANGDTLAGRADSGDALRSLHVRPLQRDA